jgi:hypothetical protein
MKSIYSGLIALSIAAIASGAYAGTMQDGSSSTRAAAFAPVPLAPVAMPLDGTWIVLDEFLPPLPSPFPNDYNWNSGNPVMFHITDLAVVTDAYDVWDSGAFQFSTPLLPNWDDLGIADPRQDPPYTLDPDVAWTRPTFSKGSQLFGPGAHSITIIATQIPTGFEDSTVAFRAYPVPFCDIKPGSDPNSINPNSKGVVSVALLGSAEVNVGDVDVSTLMFAGASPAHDLLDPLVYTEHLQDVNLDGYLDLVSHYPVPDTDIAKGDTEATISGEINGMYFYCTDDIKTPGKPD